MAVIIQFPIRARMAAERPDHAQSPGAVVLPFARVRKAKIRNSAIEAYVAERQASRTATANVPSTRTD
jgi:hypothetical protein